VETTLFVGRGKKGPVDKQKKRKYLGVTGVKGGEQEKRELSKSRQRRKKGVTGGGGGKGVKQFC